MTALRRGPPIAPPTLVVWKAELTSASDQTIKVPKGAQILSAAKTGAYDAAVWFACDPTAEAVERKIYLRMTGGTLPNPNESRFVGTLVYNYPNGPLVVHVFTEIEAERRR